MKTLAKNPANRYQDADALADDLERVKQGQEVEATPLMAAAARRRDPGHRATARRPRSCRPPEPDEGGGRKMWLGVLIGMLDRRAPRWGAGTCSPRRSRTTTRPTNVSVDDVRGLPTGTRRPSSRRRGSSSRDPPSTEASEEVADGCKRSDLLPCTVIAQDTRDAEVAPGTTITLTVAVPIRQVKVPDLTGPAAGRRRDAPRRAAASMLGSR